eukprot:gene20907-26812_t
MVLVGALWTLQGLDYIGGSAMSGERTWSVIGPIVAGLGVALGIRYGSSDAPPGLPGGALLRHNADTGP